MSENISEKKAHVIVLSNEKGGTGKSTISMHLAIRLMQEGFSVATFDLDGRQGSLSKYIENRKKFCTQQNLHLPIPDHTRVYLEENPYLITQARENLSSQILQKKNNYDAIIIDTPGTKNYLFEESHKYADTVITPISDSLIDLNVIADIDYQTGRVLKPGPYSNFIWDIKKYFENGRFVFGFIIGLFAATNYPIINPKTKRPFFHIWKDCQNYMVFACFRG